jgi:VanZ family protein
MNSKKAEKVFRIAFFLYLFIILVIATAETVEPATNNLDKFQHIAAFVFFVFLMTIAFRKAKYITVFLTGLGYGVLIEIIQHFIPYRTGDIADIIADILGLSAGIFIVMSFRKRYPDTEVAEKCKYS